ncbi:MAG TPA: DJ-1/PfpI family protein, partial [Dokdonella sp.]
MSAAPARAIPVLFVLPPRVLLLDVAGPLDALRRANLEQDRVRFDVHYCAARAALESSVGLGLSGIAALPDEVPDDAWIVLAGSADAVAFGADTDPALVAGDERAIVAWLAARVRREHRLIAICSGALLAARAGLLDGYACTTHHACCAALRALAPGAKVLDDRLYVEDRARLSSAGVTAGTDLMLHFVARYVGPAATAAIARHLVVYARRAGGDPQLSPWLEGRNHLHPAVHRVQDAIAAQPARAWTLASLATVAATSPRHLSRLFNEHAGMSLPDYVNGLRVALARELLGATRLD